MNPKDDKPVTAHRHDADAALIPNQEHEPVLRDEDRKPIRVAIEQRDPDMDPQLIWRGKRTGPLEVNAPPIYVQEHVHPKALIEDLKAGKQRETDLFGHFGLTDADREAEVEFYRHTRKWSNRFILGDSLEVMTSLAEREGLRGKVQAIYVDPPYGIRFNSNFQWSTNSREVKDGKPDHLTREPEQVRAFRDTWRDGIHSYLGYLRDRLMAARELLTENGSCFVQIGDENVHRVRALMDEVFGEENFVSEIVYRTTTGKASAALDSTRDFVVWFALDRDKAKLRRLLFQRDVEADKNYRYDFDETGSFGGVGGSPHRLARMNPLTSQSSSSTTLFRYSLCGNLFKPNKGGWKTNLKGMERLDRSSRLTFSGKTMGFVRPASDYSLQAYADIWDDTRQSGFGDDKHYVVQTAPRVIERCLLMTTDPGDLVLDPTAGSGTTAHVAEQWGRRWIAIDTSRVALALARARVMGARYPAYILRDSAEGQARMEKEGWADPRAEERPRYERDLAQGFVCERVPHITLKAIANNPAIDTLWDRHQPAVEAALENLNSCMVNFPCEHLVETGGRKGKALDFTDAGYQEMPSGEEAPRGGFMEWEVPRETGTPMTGEMLKTWQKAAGMLGESTGRGRRKARKSGDVDEIELTSLLDVMNFLSSGEGNPMGTSVFHHFTAGNVLDVERTKNGHPIMPWPLEAQQYHEKFWQARIARQRAIDEAIERKGREDDYEVLHDKPFEDKKKLRVAGPFTVESLSPHRTPVTDEDGELLEEAQDLTAESDAFRTAVLDNLAKSGLHQAGREDRIDFDAMTPWPGTLVTAKATYMQGDETRTAAIFLGPEYGTVARADVVDAATEAADAGCDVLVACGFSFTADATAKTSHGRIRILHARMNSDLHMADLKAGGGNLFAVFGEPDIVLHEADDMLRVEIEGVNVFRPATGEVVTASASEIACWFVDTDYSGDAFFVRQAYFPGAEVPYKSIRAALRTDVDEDAWDSLKRTTSRPFPRPKSGRIAVKVINHLGDEVMQVLRMSHG